MNKCDVVVVDYGMGNLFSVRRALEHCGAVVAMSSDADEILSSPRVILPGVGAFSDAMSQICRMKLNDVLQKIALSGTPLMGICLGMQLLFDQSEEHGVSEGLGLISGRVSKIPNKTTNNKSQKIPQIGWNSLVFAEGQKNWDNSILQDLKERDAVYFLHSFMASPEHKSDRIADCFYGGHKISAVVGRKNVMGCQFHPEKSGEVGLSVLRRFLSI